MKTANLALGQQAQQISQHRRYLCPEGLKRDPTVQEYPLGQHARSYPSPPMSETSSPRGPPATELPSSSSYEQSVSAVTSTTELSLMPSVALAPPPLGLSFYRPVSYVPSASLPATPSSVAPTSPNLPVVQPARDDPSAALPTDLEHNTGSRSTISKGRKSKAHVASACINCKRAHLSCDVNRPCTRCVASGKQDTCFDVQHKKRGRPRLREEGDFSTEQAETQTGSVAAIGSNIGVTPRRIASTRHRRQDSFRSLRSQGSDGSNIAPSPTYPYPPPPTATQPTFGFPDPPPPHQLSDYEVPTAYLDMDLSILKANMPFRYIMLEGQDVAGRQLRDIAAPVGGQSFQEIRNALRTEREDREPSYMPPISQPGRDALHAVSEADVEVYTQGSRDNIHTWTQTRIGPAAQTFPARVRLAKTSIYFVAVTLPSFRPAQPMAPPVPAPRRAPALQRSFLPGPQINTSRDYLPPSQPRLAYAESHISFLPSAVSVPTSAVPPHAPSQQSSAQAYPPPPYQPHQPYQPYQSSLFVTPRLPAAEPPTETSAFTMSRAAARELPQPVVPAGTGPFSPVTSVSPSIPAAATVSAREQSQPQDPAQSQSEDADVEGTPRKRRRLDLEDVIHR